MKKLLLLAAALACSGVAQAEIFSCTSTFGVGINAESVVGTGIPSRTWIANTRRGLRYSGVNIVADDYSGECEVIARFDSASTTVCTKYHEEKGNLHAIKIDKLTTGKIIFKASILDLNNFSYAGFCTEI